MNQVTINGKTITSNGVISVINGEVIIDGVRQDNGDSKQINISIEGNVESLSAPGCQTITIHGNVNRLQSTSGDIDVSGDVTGGIQSTSGGVEVNRSVEGGIITTSGDVKCGDVSGSITSVTGNIKHK